VSRCSNRLARSSDVRGGLARWSRTRTRQSPPARVRAARQGSAPSSMRRSSVGAERQPWHARSRSNRECLREKDADLRELARGELAALGRAGRPLDAMLKAAPLLQGTPPPYERTLCLAIRAGSRGDDASLSPPIFFRMSRATPSGSAGASEGARHSRARPGLRSASRRVIRARGGGIGPQSASKFEGGGPLRTRVQRWCGWPG